MLNPPSRKVQTKGSKKVCDLHQKRLRLVESHLCGSELIFNFLIVNHHKLSLHFRKEKVHVLEMHCVLRFQRRLETLCHILIICQSS